MYKKIFKVFIAILLLVSVNCIIYIYLQKQVDGKYQETVNMLNEANNENKQLHDEIIQLEKSLDTVNSNSDNKKVTATDIKDTNKPNNIDFFIKELNKDVLSKDDTTQQGDTRKLYYFKDGAVYIKNGADGTFSVYGDSNVIDLNKPYKELIEKFIALYNNVKNNISDEQLIKAGFSNPETIKQYGFSPFLNISQDIEVICKEYKINRELYELQIEKYKNNSISEEKLLKSMDTFINFKEIMNKFLSQNMMGDY